METTRPIPQLNIDNVINPAWALTKRYWPKFVQLFFSLLVSTALIMVFVFICIFVAALIKQLGMTEEQIQPNQPETNTEGAIIVGGCFLLGAILFYLFCAYQSNSILRMMLYASEKRSNISLYSLLQGGRRGFWFFFGCVTLYSIITGLGQFMCYILGFFFSIRLMFVPIIASHHPEYTCGQVFSKAWKLTENNFANLLILGIVVFFINVLGLLCLGVGILVTLILSYFAYEEAYRQLASGTELFSKDTLSDLFPESPIHVEREATFSPVEKKTSTIVKETPRRDQKQETFTTKRISGYNKNEKG